MDNFPLSDKYVHDERYLTDLASIYRLQEAIIGHTELAVISTNIDGIIIGFNSAAERMLGYTSEEIVGKYTPEIFHDRLEVTARARELSTLLNRRITPGFDVFIAHAVEMRTPERREWTYLHKNGTSFPVMLSVTGLWDDHDNLIGYAGIASDITDQKQAEAKLKTSEAHLQALVNSLDDLVIEVDSKGDYLNIWTRKDEFLFAPRERYTAKNIFDILGNTLATQYKAAIERVVKTGQPETLDYKSINPDDDGWRNAKFNFVPPDHVLICIRDITQRKRSELTLIKSEEKFRALAENIPGIIYLCNNDATYSMIYLNNKTQEVLGYPAEDFMSGKLSFLQLYHPEDAPRIFESVDKALSKQESFHLTYRMANSKGEWRWFEEMGAGVFHDDILIYIEGFISDITLQKKAEEEIKKIAEENYRIFNSTINLSVISGYDGFFKRVNPSWTKVLGWSEQELTTKPFFDFVHPDDIAPTIEAFSHISDGNDLPMFENRYRCKDGSYRWLLWGSASDSKRQLVYASAIDITERKNFELELLISKQNLETAANELQKQNSQLSEFAHIISHNLRSPVGNIRTLISLVNERSNKEDYQLIFEKLRNTADSLGDTLNDLMEILQIKEERSIEHSTLLFEDILRKVKYDLDGEIIKCGAVISSNFAACPEINYPKTYLESIVLNLVSNAIKYRSPERLLQIYVSTTRENGKPVLRVKDNGLGIDMALYGEKLFGLRKTFHEHKEARGVGLFLTKTQIETLGGTIRAESEVDKGTTIIVNF